MVKVSVIIPVYNVEKYLRKCLDSIVAQTFRDMEIICVDDGSTDSCPQIVDEYALNDSRVQVIHKKNAGYGAAINSGMDKATGEYIAIAESDDHVLPGMYETLYDQAVKHHLDFIKSDSYFFWECFDYTRYFHQEKLEGYYNRVLLHDDLAALYDFPICTWSGLYRRKFLYENDIRHNETPGASYQDTGFWLQVMSVYQRAMWTDKPFYMYRRDNPNSSVKSKQKMMAINSEYDFVSDILKKKKLNEELKYCNYQRLIGELGNFQRIDDALKEEYADVIKKDWEKYRDNLLCNDKTAFEKLEKWMDGLLEDPKSFCAGIIDKKEKQKRVFDKNDKIIIYGSGEIAGGFFDQYQGTDILKKVIGVAVSNTPKQKKYFGYDVKKIDEYIEYKDNVLILICVSQRISSEIFEVLDKLGFSKYCLWEY